MMMPPLEVWAGIECTVNRVGDAYFDQLRRSGHHERGDDLDRVAGLGPAALRYPVLWERVAPSRPADFSWSDARLARLRELGIRPIVGLVHHGSGPRSTSLVDPAFPEGLAAFARAVAERYPWIAEYTPVNEPLTTARFSALYGHWYPHRRDDKSFVRALLGQCKATALAMRAMREVNPDAKLVQTEDFGVTESTPRLAYQAAYENERRFLSLDLLCGRVRAGHPLLEWLRGAGASDDDLAFFQENPCPPDVIGINYYVTSDRYLDEDLDRYPACLHGGNGRHRYADVEAVRAARGEISGHFEHVRRLWERYGIPLAITEAHLGGAREEQLRWFVEAYQGCLAARAAGISVQAITMWALFGSFDWNSLVTRDEGHYEPGAFDVRAPSPRPTALAGLLRDISAGRSPDHPVLAVPGWWRRPERVLYHDPTARVELSPQNCPEKPARPILITGGSGTLGAALGRIAAARGLPYRIVSRGEMDIADPRAVERMFAACDPWAVINAAGYVRVDDAESERERCMRENVMGPKSLAEACRVSSIRLVTFSSDLVFDGARGRPYVESDRVGPLCVYGLSKAHAEELTLAIHPSSLVIRTAAFFGPWDEHNFVFKAVDELARRGEFFAADDAVVSPTYVPDLANATLDLLIDGESGLWHVANPGAVTWHDLARRSAELAGVDTSGLRGCSWRALDFAAPRPAYCALGSERGILLPPLEVSLERYMNERTPPWPIPGEGAARGSGRCVSS